MGKRATVTVFGTSGFWIAIVNEWRMNELRSPKLKYLGIGDFYLGATIFNVTLGLFMLVIVAQQSSIRAQ